MKSTAAFGFENVFKGYYMVWCFTFLCAAVFHTKDTPLTERLDYYSAHVAIVFTHYTTYLRYILVLLSLQSILDQRFETQDFVGSSFSKFYLLSPLLHASCKI